MVRCSHYRKGFSLVELAVVMGAMTILASALLPMAIRTIEMKAGEKTAMEMALIQEAARHFYLDHNKTWPTSDNNFEALRNQNYIGANWSVVNPWNKPYVMETTSASMSVATDVPSRVADLVRSRLPESSDSSVGEETIIGAQIFKTVTSMVGAPGMEEVVAPGVIVAWSGLIADIPKGWALCDGLPHDRGDGTMVTPPNLIDKFIVGGSHQDSSDLPKTNIMGKVLGQYEPVDRKYADGADTDKHTLSIEEMPRHQHSSIGEAFPEIAKWGTDPNYGRGQMGLSNSDWDNYMYMTSWAGGDQGHKHHISVEALAPPFYALAFIMKL